MPLRSRPKPPQYKDMPAGNGGHRFLLCRKIKMHPLPLPLGEVAEQGEDGEGFQTLSVTCGDSSPRGRAKAAA